MQARVLSIVRAPSNTYGEVNPNMDAKANVNVNNIVSMGERSRAIHTRAITRAKTFLKAEIEIVESLREVEDDRTYRHFKQTSIYEYAMKRMKL